MIIQYELDFFRKKIFNNEIPCLNEDVENILFELEKNLQMTNKTNINDNKYYGNHHKQYNKVNYKYKDRDFKHKKNDIKQHKISDQEWVTIRNFKKTELNKLEGSDMILGNIRKYMNKMTEHTFNEMKKEILDLIKCLNDDMIINEVNKLILNIASENSFYNHLYADLYKDISELYPAMKDYCIEYVEYIKTSIKDIVYYDSNDNYDKFCEYNKDNEKRRSILLFYLHLVKINYISYDIILNIIYRVQSLIREKLKEQYNKSTSEIIQELTEILYILITKINELDFVKEHEEWNTIIEEVSILSTLKLNQQKGYPNLTKKILFRHMDILDEIQ